MKEKLNILDAAKLDTLVHMHEHKVHIVSLMVPIRPKRGNHASLPLTNVEASGTKNEGRAITKYDLA